MMRFVLPAIGLSLGLHAGLLAWAGGPNAVEHGAESVVSSTVIVFDAQPAPAVSASADADEVAEQQPVQADDLPAETLPDKEPAEAQPVEIVEDAETEQVTEPVTEPVPVQPVETRPFVPIPKLKPQVPAEFAQKQLSSEKPERRKSKAKPVPKDKSRKKPVNKADRRKAKQRPAGKNRAQTRAGSAGRSGGASAGEKAAYARRVLSHIQRYKSFPSGARAGKVGLKVRISASGQLLSASVRRSSGHHVLDKAAVATARRASPYPKPPGSRNFSFTVSLRYVR